MPRAHMTHSLKPMLDVAPAMACVADIVESAEQAEVHLKDLDRVARDGWTVTGCTIVPPAQPITGRRTSNVAAGCP